MPITLENVEFTYMAKTPYERKALQCVSLTVDKGEFVAVIGHTGSGKSTLVQHLNGLLKPSAGKAFRRTNAPRGYCRGNSNGS